jgi:glycosyltransferase involved in cell wall biosynthesis
MPPPAVLVYRDTILPRSEQEFMRRQYAAFATLRPLWIGRRATPDLDRAAFPLAPLLSGPAGIAFKLLGHVPDAAKLGRLGATIVHAQFGRGGALALPLARRLALPLVVTLHGGEVSKNAHYRPFALLRRRLPALAAYASAFVCVSDAVRQQALARGFPADRLVVLPIGTDTLAEPPRTGPGEGILFVGRFVEMKGVAPLLEAVAQLRARGINAPVTLVGDGPDGPALRARAEGLGVTFAGWQAQPALRDAMRQARLLALPSIRARSGEAEGLPSVAAEAMGLALPVIASDAANTAGLIVPGENGLVVPAADPAALADAIARLLADPALSRHLGQAARAHVARHFDAAAQSAKLERLLLTAAAAPPGTALDFARTLG